MDERSPGALGLWGSMQGTNATLTGLRVLVLPSSGIAPEEDYIFQPLKEAKKRWGWDIDILCGRAPSAEYRDLVAPSGKLFLRPNPTDIASWEADSESVADLDWRLQEAERIAGVPIGQIVLAADSKIGRAFVAPVLHLADTALSRRVLNDNLEPYRTIRRLFQFADEMLEVSTPDFIYTYEWAKPWLFTVWLAAARRGIPCVAIRRSKIRSDYCFVTTDRLMFNTAAREHAAAKRKSRAQVSEAAKQYVRSFREQPRMVKYVQTKWQRVAQEGWLDWHIKWARGVARDLLRAFCRGKVPRKSVLKRLFLYNRRVVLARRQQSFFRTYDGGELDAMKYVYFPMHKETDLPVNFQAACWYNQANTIGLLASVLPSGYRLLVREHRHNFGLRPTRYYRELAQLPNVVLIDAFDSQFKYLRNADLIVTENGSSGWEGLLLGRRVLTLAPTFYDGAGLTCKVEKPDLLGVTILELLSSPPVKDQASHDRDLACMVDAEFETTFVTGPEDTDATLDRISEALLPLLSSRSSAASAIQSRTPMTEPSVVRKHGL